MTEPRHDNLRRFMIAGASTTTALVGAGAVGPTAETAQADIVYASVNMPVPATTAGLYINVETLVNNSNPTLVPGWDLNPWGSTALNWFNPSAPAGGVYVRYPSAASGVGNLDLGYVVDATSVYTSGGSTFGANPGEWVLNGSNYFGFRFVGADSQIRYGWGRIDVGSAATIRTIRELAYESTPGAGIAVGAIPEPSQLMMIASGAAGLLAWRQLRRRIAG